MTIDAIISCCLTDFHVTLRWQCFPNPKIIQRSGVSCCRMNGHILNKCFALIFSFLQLKEWLLVSASLSVTSFLTLEASLAFCLLNYRLLDWYVTLPCSSLFCLLWELWYRTSVCVFCCMEESFLIMKHRERQRQICSAPQIFKVPQWPRQCWGSKKKNYFIIKYLTSVGTRPDHPLGFRLGFRSFCLRTCLTKSHTLYQQEVWWKAGHNIDQPVCQVIFFEAQCKNTSTTTNGKAKINNRTIWQINTSFINHCLLFLGLFLHFIRTMISHFKPAS